MDTKSQTLIGFVYFAISIILWIYLLILESNFYRNISKNEYIFILAVLVIFLLYYSFWYRNVKRISIGMLNLIPMIIWGGSIADILNDYYSQYYTILILLGFFSILICFIQTINRVIKQYKLKKY